LETIHDSWGGGNGVLLHSYLLFTKQNHGNYSRLICFSGFSIKWVCAVVAAPWQLRSKSVFSLMVLEVIIFYLIFIYKNN
jgi:hypothetical protein